MTDQHRHQPLDERGRAAGRDVLDAAARRSRPAFDPDRPTDVPLRAAGAVVPRRRALAVAAALVLVAGVAFWSTGSDGGDTTPAVTTGSPRPFLATDLPDGFTFLGAAAGSTPQEEGFGPLVVYGPAADEPMLGLLVVTGFFEEFTIEAETVTVDGVEATVTEDPSGGRTALVTVEEDTVLATSPGLDTDTLVRLAREAVVEGSTAQVAHELLPDRWRRLDIDPAGAPISPVVAWHGGPPVGDTSVYGSRLDVGYVTDEETSEGVAAEAESVTVPTIVVGTPGVDGSLPAEGEGEGGDALGSDADEEFGAPAPLAPSRGYVDPGPTLVSVTTVTGDEARLHAATLWVDEATEVEVRGRRALTGTDGFEGYETRLLTWQESPGEIVRMWGTEASLEDLLALAEALEPVDAATWDDLVERTMLGDFAPSMPDETRDIVGEGTFADGTAWVLRVVSSQGYDTPSLMVATITGRDGSMGSASGFERASGGGGGLLGYELVETGGRSFAAGLVGDAVRTLELRDTDGAVLQRPGIVEGSARRGWAAETTTDSFEIVALDDAGTVVDRLTIENGSVVSVTETPTPDPDGPPG